MKKKEKEKKRESNKLSLKNVRNLGSLMIKKKFADSHLLYIHPFAYATNLEHLWTSSLTSSLLFVFFNELVFYDNT